jgi:Transglycosylase SLT domain
MIRLAGPLLCCALALLSAHANAQAGASSPAMAHQDTAQSAAPNGPKTLAKDPLTTDDICHTLEQAAAENALPIEFFARVIWQESRFNARAVSRKGAEGIAQFMPRTSDWRGLIDPFDSIAALKASASYLRDLRNRFGNLGLAAAAYNAGPQRVQDWLVGRGSLPKETLSYIQIVTGHSALEWSGGPAQSNLALPEVVPCSQMAKSFDPTANSEKDQRGDHASSSPSPKPGWGVQLVGRAPGCVPRTSKPNLRGIAELLRCLFVEVKNREGALEVRHDFFFFRLCYGSTLSLSLSLFVGVHSDYS